MPSSSSSLPAAAWLFIALACVVGYLSITRPAFDPEPGVGKKVEDFSIVTLGDPLEVKKLSEISEPVLLVNFWGTWCPPCRAELPEIVALGKKLESEKRFRLLAISCGSGGNDDVGEIRQETRDYLTQEKLDLISYSDPTMSARRAVITAQGTGQFGYPTTVLLDQSRTIRAVWSGYSPGVVEEMEAKIKRLLLDPTATGG